MNPSISILLGIGSTPLCDRLAKWFNSTSDLYVIATGHNEEDVREQIKRLRPVVAILSWDQKPGMLLDLITTLSYQNISPLVMSDTITDKQTVGLLRQGLNGVIPSDIAPEMLFKSVRAVASGKIWINRKTIEHLLDQLKGGDRSNSRPTTKIQDTVSQPRIPTTSFRIGLSQRQNRFNLTPREMQIVQALAEGMTNKEIGCVFGISEFTVKHFVGRIFDKFGVCSRLELATFATHHGLTKDVDSALVSAVN
jgi:DNA-binding NarL/FixJ family response regulator